MYNVKLTLPHTLRELDDVIKAMQEKQPKQGIIKKADMELRQQQIELSAKELNVKFERLAVEKKQLAELQSISQLLEVISNQMEMMTNSRAIFYDEFNTKAATLAFAIASKVIYNLVDADENFILEIVNNAIQESGNDDELLIHIHPDDKKMVDAHLPKLKKAYYDKALKLEVDPDIDRGGCLIETESGDIDARIDKQLAVIERSLMEHFGNANAGQNVQ